MAEKRYYWLKLQEDFFSSKRIKKLRKIAGGDTYTIIYLKMQLLSIRNGGVLKYSGLESSFAEELALDLDEEAENVAVTLQYLMSVGLIETSNNFEFLLPFAAMNTGSEGSGAKRVRDFRERQKALQGNADVTRVKQISNGEKEIEIDKEKDPPIAPPRGASTKDADFDRFWKVYPNKTGKQAARKAFDKVKVSVDILIAAVEEQKTWEKWTKDGGQYIPNPSTWLNQGRWEDEENITSGSGSRIPAERRTKAPGEYKGRDFFDDD